MTNLETRFHAEIDKAHFTLFEIEGFRKDPRLALIAGLAMGYKMATEDYCVRKEAKDV